MLRSLTSTLFQTCLVNTWKIIISLQNYIQLFQLLLRRWIDEIDVKSTGTFVKKFKQIIFHHHYRAEKRGKSTNRFAVTSNRILRFSGFAIASGVTDRRSLWPKIDIRSSRNRNLATSISRHHVNALWLIVRRSTTRFSLGGQRKLSSVRAVFLISPQILKETRMASSRTCDWFQELILNEVL